MTARHASVVLAVFLMGIALLGAVSCGEGKVDRFSATQVTLRQDGKEVSRHALNVTPERVRMEMDSPMRKGSMIVVLRRDKGLTWIVNPERKTYFERPADENEWDRALRRAWKTTGKDLGREEVSGYQCTKKKGEITSGMMGKPTTVRATIWVSTRFDLPLRTQQENGQTVELRDVKPGRQNSDLFEIPEGYTKVDDFVSLFGGRPRPGAKPDDKGLLRHPRGL